MYLEIILNLPINQGFTYSYIPPEDEKPELAGNDVVTVSVFEP